MTRVAIVLNAAIGYGPAIADALRQDGWYVVAHEQPNAGRGGAERWRSEDQAECAAAVATIETERGAIGTVIFNAPPMPDRTLSAMSATDWVQMNCERIDPLFAMAKAVWPAMCRAGHGRIIAVLPLEAVLGRAGTIAQAAAATATRGYVKSLALEGGRYGVTVNSVAGPALDADPTRDASAGYPSHAADIARCILFLCGPESGYVTGSLMVADGGIARF